MDIDDLTDDELDALASKLAGRLPTGRHGDTIVTTRRQLLAAAAGGSAGVAALCAVGQVGTQSSPEDVFAYNLDVQNGAQFNGTDLSGVGSLSTESLGLTPLDQTTFELNGGETAVGTITGADLGDPIIATAFPSGSPSNDVGVTNPEIWYLESNDLIRWRLTETENAGGGEITTEFYVF